MEITDIFGRTCIGSDRTDIGSFEVTCGKLLVTDPCYTKGTWCTEVLENVLNGKWNSFINESVFEYTREIVDEEASIELYFKNKDKIDIWRKKDGTIPEKEYFEEYRKLTKVMKTIVIRTKRPRDICIFHVDYAAEIIEQCIERTKICIGVDSGQAGFFDLEQYPQNPVDEENRKKFYDVICDATCTSDYKNNVQHVTGTTLSFGAVSVTHYGDGSYNCYIARNDDGKIIAATIDFVGLRDDNEDEENMEDEIV